jgi:hypothetical protein
MKQQAYFKTFIALLLLFYYSAHTVLYAQDKKNEQFKKASKKIERGYKGDNKDTLAQGYFDLGESYYQKGGLVKSEEYYKKSKDLFERTADAEGIAKSSRALAKVQEELHKNKEAIGNYSTAQQNNVKTGDVNATILNRNDIARLSRPDSINMEAVLQENINLGIKNRDTGEIVANYSRMAKINLLNKETGSAVGALEKAYQFSANNPQQALRYNQLITDVYVKDKDFTKAIKTKETLLDEPFVQNSSKTKVSEVISLADIYIQKKDAAVAVRLLNESYAISVKHGYTAEAKRCVEKLDSIFQNSGQKEMSLQLYKNFLGQLPAMLAKDSSLTDNQLIAETEDRLKLLETEKRLKDDLIRKKNILNYWLTGSIIILAVFLAVILYVFRKLKIKNKKIALQSLRREMNPHFIFNSLNSINQFIANNNEMEANQYLAKFSALMRSVMENSKEDFVLFSKEAALLQNYLELEKSRFPDKFQFKVEMDNALYTEEQLYIPGMLIQPHLENAIWHGLRYIEAKGCLRLSFIKKQQSLQIIIEDNGIGIAESKKVKTPNQQQHSGRGITNTLERIKILNELYHQNITCVVTDKPAPDHGVKVTLTVPLLKHIRHED